MKIPFRWRDGLPASDPAVKHTWLQLVTDTGIEGWSKAVRGPIALDLNLPGRVRRGCLRPWFILCLASAACWERARAGQADLTFSAPDARWEKVVFEVRLSDPVYPERGAITHQAVQLRDRDGFPTGYALPVTAEVCTDKKCYQVEVTLHWNLAGDFARLEYAPGNPLTKKEHEPFTPADYANLDAILKDRESILARHSLAFLANPDAAKPGVDALAGATPESVREAVVPDAAYTSWVLWRYANGEVVPQLMRRTEQSCTPEFLCRLLEAPDRQAARFGLQYVLKHHPADGRYLEAVLRAIEQGDPETIGLGLRFVSGAVPDRERRQASLVATFGRMKSRHSPLLLAYLSTERELSPATLEGLAARLGPLEYYQVHLTLSLLEQRGFSSPEAEAAVAQLLEGRDFFIARRAYEHLTRQAPGEATARNLEAFRERYRDRL